MAIATEADARAFEKTNGSRMLNANVRNGNLMANLFAMLQSRSIRPSLARPSLVLNIRSNSILDVITDKLRAANTRLICTFLARTIEIEESTLTRITGLGLIQHRADNKIRTNDAKMLLCETKSPPSPRIPILPRRY